MQDHCGSGAEFPAPASRNGCASAVAIAVSPACAQDNASPVRSGARNAYFDASRPRSARLIVDRVPHARLNLVQGRGHYGWITEMGPVIASLLRQGRIAGGVER